MATKTQETTKLSKPSGLTSVLVPLPTWTRFLSLLPNPDKVVEEEGPEIFEIMLQDPHIFAVLQQRKSLLLSKDWDIFPQGTDSRAKELAQKVKEWLLEINLYHLINNLLACLNYGYSVVEAVWQLRDGLWVPAKFLHHDFKRFGFSPEGSLLLLNTPSGIKTLNQRYKFIVAKNEATPDNPYGKSVLTRCYWPWRFKTAGFKFWITVLEKFGVPSLAALFESTMVPDQAREIVDYISQELQKITSGSVGALAGIKDIITISGEGEAEDFKLLIDLCNAEISKAILGETLTVEVGERGAYAHGRVHLEVLDFLVKRDAKNLEALLNETLISWLVELNAGASALKFKPIFRFDFEPTADWEKIKDALDRGVPVSKKALYVIYNLPEPEEEEDAFIAPLIAAKAGLFADNFSEKLEKRFSDKEADDFFVRHLPRKMCRLT